MEIVWKCRNVIENKRTDSRKFKRMLLQNLIVYFKVALATFSVPSNGNNKNSYPFANTKKTIIEISKFLSKFTPAVNQCSISVFIHPVFCITESIYTFHFWMLFQPSLKSTKNTKTSFGKF